MPKRPYLLRPPRTTFSISLPQSTERLVSRAAHQAKQSRSAWVATRIEVLARHELELAKTEPAGIES